MSGYGFLKKVLNAFVQIVLPYKLIGKEKVGQGACVIVGNHYRIWDIVHMACVTKDRVHFIAKQELWKSRFIAYLCKVVGAIPVSRDGTDAKAVMSALRCLKNGEKISMFPEGTRSRTGQIGRFHEGAFMLARQAGVGILPCVSVGTGSAFDGWKFNFKNRFRVNILPPLSAEEVASTGAKELTVKVHDMMCAEQEKMKNEK